MTAQEWIATQPYSPGTVPTLHDPIVIVAGSRGGYDRLTIAQTSRIDAFTKLHVGEGIDIGEHVHIASFCDVNVGGGGLHIGDGATLSSHVVIATGQSRIREGKSGSAQHPDFEPECGMLFIENNVTVFAGAIIRVKPNTVMRIGEGAVIGAGALVLRNVDPHSLVMGVPARWRKDLFRG